MKYVMSMAANQDHLKRLIMADTEMTDMEKLHDVFCVDKDELKEKFPHLYQALFTVLENDTSKCTRKECTS